MARPLLLSPDMTIGHDIRYAVRQLRRSPGFTAAAVVSLALGLGANTAIFSLLDQVLLRSLPVSEPDELVRIRWNGPRYGVTISGDTLSYPAYRDIRDQNQVFSGVLCRFRVPLSVGYQRQTERVAGELVSGNYFEVLRVGAALGRTLTPEDDRVPGGHPLAMISHAYWVSRFSADPNILGRTLVVDGLPLTIVGVGAQGFDGIELGYSPGLWIPVAMKAQMTQGWFSEAVTLENRRTYWVQVFARLKPGISPEAARVSLQPPFRAMLERELREPGFEEAGADARAAFLRSSLDVQPGAQGRTSLRQSYETPLKVLMAIVAMVLLIACANVANLLLERAAGRQREVAVRMALGARTGQIVRYAIVESVLLAVLGGGVGLLVAAWMTEFLVGFVPTDDSSINLVTTPDLRVLAFTLIVCLATGVLFGLAPALAARRIDPSPTLKHDARGIAAGQRWLRTSLVIAQVSLSLVLAIGAGQFLRTLLNLRRVDVGLRPSNVIVFAVNPSLNGYDKPRSREFYRSLLDRLQQTPGVEAVGASAIRALDDDWWGGVVSADGESQPVNPVAPSFNLVSPGYLSALGIPLLDGRDFSVDDRTRAARVALVNESFARQYFHGRSPIGRRIAFGPPGTPTDIEVVGVMKDAKYTNVRDDINPQAFLNNDQNPDIQSIHVYVKTALDPRHFYQVIRRTVQTLDSHVPVFAMRTMEAQANMTLARERMVTSLTSAFGLLATVLAAIGVYALMAFNVTRRTREIGVRVALGAQRGQVFWLVLRQVMVMVAIGTAVGVPVAWSLVSLVRAQLYGVQPWDWISTSAAAVTLVGVAALAGFVPARRATAIDPIQALRTE
jgi:predicted permease